MNELTLMIILILLLVLGLLGVAYLIWPSEPRDETPRHTTSSKNGRGYWE
ncbi:MAG: hypothetical protein IPL78_27940 [Chloroflexi bacterium]|nr:hypothetical protein [Chloroflexota bacterium]